MTELTPIGIISADLMDHLKKLHGTPKVYSDLVAYQIRRSLLEGDLIPDAKGLRVDQMQQNGQYCVHQLRVTLPEGMGTYRVIVAPDNAPIFVGSVAADEHFALPLTEKVVQLKAAE